MDNSSSAMLRNHHYQEQLQSAGIPHNQFHGSVGGAVPSDAGVLFSGRPHVPGVFDTSATSLASLSEIQSGGGISHTQFHPGIGGAAPSDAGVLFSGRTQGAGVFDTSTAPLSVLHGISMEWTPEEQAILEEGMIKYASESNISRYAKIALKLNNKTVRDVAMRCKWISKRDISKRRKEDFNLMKKGKDRKEKVSDLASMSSHVGMEAGLVTYAQAGISGRKEPGISYAAVEGANGELLRQNFQAFEQISANFTSHQLQENVALLCRARKNIRQLLNNLGNPPNIVKQMPPLQVEINRDLANTILPSSPE